MGELRDVALLDADGVGVVGNGLLLGTRGLAQLLPAVPFQAFLLSSRHREGWNMSSMGMSSSGLRQSVLS